MIKSVSIFSSRPWNNQVKRRYKIVLTDLQGFDHEVIIGSFKVEPTDDGTSFAANLLAAKKRDEVSDYISDIRKGTNPFLTDSLWNTRVELLVPILTDALSLPATDAIVYNGLPYINLVTDAELMALFGKNQQWVDTLRDDANNLLNGKATFDSYSPPLGSV